MKKLKKHNCGGRKYLYSVKYDRYLSNGEIFSSLIGIVANDKREALIKAKQQIVADGRTIKKLVWGKATKVRVDPKYKGA